MPPTETMMDDNGNGKRGVPKLRFYRQRQDSDVRLNFVKILSPLYHFFFFFSIAIILYSTLDSSLFQVPVSINQFPCFQDGAECTDLDFIYDDADSHVNEIAELYSYTEQYELQFNVKVSEQYKFIAHLMNLANVMKGCYE